MNADLSPDRPLPWKAVSYGGAEPSTVSWDVINDHGDPMEEFSVLEYTTEAEAKFIARACNAHAAQVAALQRVLDWIDHGKAEDRRAVTEQVQAALELAKGGA